MCNARLSISLPRSLPVSRSLHSISLCCCYLSCFSKPHNMRSVQYNSIFCRKATKRPIIVFLGCLSCAIRAPLLQQRLCFFNDFHLLLISTATAISKSTTSIHSLLSSLSKSLLSPFVSSQKHISPPSKHYPLLVYSLAHIQHTHTHTHTHTVPIDDCFITASTRDGSKHDGRSPRLRFWCSSLCRRCRRRGR